MIKVKSQMQVKTHKQWEIWKKMQDYMYAHTLIQISIAFENKVFYRQAGLILDKIKSEMEE